MTQEENFNDDEKIRKVLLNDFNNHCSYYYCEGVNRDMIIAWLEKQKAIDVLDEEEREFVDNVDSYRKEVDAAYQKGYNKGVKDTLEKQAYQKGYNKGVKDTLEKQGKSLKKDNNERNMVELKLRKWEYFGSSTDRSVWHNVFLNKPSMKLFINSCTIINSHDAIKNIDICDGQNRLPDAFHEDFANAIKNEEFNEIVFGIQKRQDWGYVYLVKSGIYYFFHCFSK